jgi:iron-regulated transporter 1
VTLALWNVASVGLQYWLFVSVYNSVPALSENVQLRRKSAAALSSSEIVALANEEQRYGEEMSDWRVGVANYLSFLPCWDSWAVYMRQDVMLPGVAVAILYFNVLR